MSLVAVVGSVTLMVRGLDGLVLWGLCAGISIDAPFGMGSTPCRQARNSSTDATFQRSGKPGEENNREISKVDMMDFPERQERES